MLVEQKQAQALDDVKAQDLLAYLSDLAQKYPIWLKPIVYEIDRHRNSNEVWSPFSVLGLKMVLDEIKKRGVPMISIKDQVRDIGDSLC